MFDKLQLVQNVRKFKYCSIYLGLAEKLNHMFDCVVAIGVDLCTSNEEVHKEIYEHYNSNQREIDQMIILMDLYITQIIVLSLTSPSINYNCTINY